MIRCMRMWTGSDGHSAFEEGEILIGQGVHGRASGLPIEVRELSFRETGTELDTSWHRDPVPQYVLTLTGTVEFAVTSGATFIIRPGDVLLVQDNSGSGHSVRLIGDEPWRRAYVVYAPSANLRFRTLSDRQQHDDPS
jgi:quercetin dioxygenase-like cupin family protein